MFMTFYTKKRYVQFSDINECLTIDHPCQQNCTNQNGSYLCGCRAGYSVNSTDPSKCVGKKNINQQKSSLQYMYFL